MSRYFLVLLWLLSGLTLGYRHLYPHGNHIRLLMGRPDPNELVLLKAAGATFEIDNLGIWIKPDEAGATGLFQLSRFHRTCCDLAEENFANARTAKTADGTPYRRHFAYLGNDSRVVVETDKSDYKWVYDPANPNAEHDGPHAGYVAMPNVNEISEKTTYAYHRGYISIYERAIGKIEQQNPPLVAWRSYETGVGDWHFPQAAGRVTTNSAP